MMRTPVRTMRDKTHPLDHARHRVNRRRIQSFLEIPRGKNSWQGLSQHGFPRSRRSDHKKIMPTGRRDLQRTFGHRLPLDLRKIDETALDPRLPSRRSRNGLRRERISSPVLRMAATTRSLASRTDASGNPTMEKEGIPLARLTSTCTRAASIPIKQALSVLAIILRSSYLFRGINPNNIHGFWIDRQYVYCRGRSNASGIHSMCPASITITSKRMVQPSRRFHFI